MAPPTSLGRARDPSERRERREGGSRSPGSGGEEEDPASPAPSRPLLLRVVVRVKGEKGRELLLAVGQEEVVAAPTALCRGLAWPRRPLLAAGSSGPADSYAFEERGIVILHRLSPRMQFAFLVCIIYWSRCIHEQ